MGMEEPPREADFSADDLHQIARGFFRSRILLTAFELGLFTALGEGSAAAADVAKALGTDRRATDRLMSALVALGLLTKEGDRFANGPATGRFLVEGGPEYMAGLRHTVNLWDMWSTLTAAVRAGTSVWERPGGEEGERWTEAFLEAMHYSASARAPRLVELVDLGGVSRLLDVGGGSGAYAIAFVGAHEGMTATVVDLPHVTPLTRKYIAAEGLEDRIDVVEADAHEEALPRGYDLVFMSHVVHSNSPAGSEALIANGAASLNVGGRLLVQDFIVDEGRASPPGAAVFALNMLVATAAGDTYTEAEVRAWFEAAGLVGVERADTDFETTLVVGKRP